MLLKDSSRTKNNQELIAETAVVKLGYRSAILREHRTLSSLQRLHEVVDCFFGLEVDFF